MNHSIITLLVLMMTWITAQGIKTRIIDKETGNPIAGVTAFSEKGVILGISNSLGEVDLGGVGNFPVTIRSMGFVPVTCDRPTAEIRLTPAEYELSEVVVSPHDNLVTRVVCYMREYVSCATDHDTIITYNEHMVDYFFTDKKIKKFKPSKGPRMLNSIMRVRKINEECDSVRLAEYPDEVLNSLRYGMAFESCRPQLPADVCTVSDNAEVSENIKPVFLSVDRLADKKNHVVSPWKLKVLGLTTDFTDAVLSIMVLPRADCTFLPEDIIFKTFSCRLLGKGKLWKYRYKTSEPVEFHVYNELYPVAFTYHTVEEAKELQKNPPATPMEVPSTVMPLTPGMSYLVEHAK